MVSIFEILEVLVTWICAVNVLVGILERALNDSNHDDDSYKSESENAEDYTEEEDAAAFALDDTVNASNGE